MIQSTHDIRPYTLVLLPGLDGSGAQFTPLIDCLPGWLSPHVVAYPPAEPLSDDALTDFVLERWPDDDRVVLLGESFAGPVALRVATLYPERLSALILCSTYVTPPYPFLLPVVRPVLPLFLHHPPRPLLRYFLTGADAPDEYVEWVTGILRSVSRPTLEARLRSVQATDARRDLANCRIPLLSLHGQHDHLVGEGKRNELRKLRPDAFHTELPGPHQLIERQPVQVLTAIEHFLRAQEQ